MIANDNLYDHGRCENDLIQLEISCEFVHVSQPHFQSSQETLK